MKSKKNALFMYKALPLVMLILLVATSGGLSVVWLRQQISQSAARIQTYEKALAQLERRFQYLEVKIALVHQPEYLKRRIKHLGLNLAPPREQQIVRLTPRTDSTNPLPLDVEPFITSYELAFLESSTLDTTE